MRSRGGIWTKLWRAAVAVSGTVGLALSGGCISRQSQPEYIYGIPTILSVEVQAVEGVPGRVNAVVHGFVFDQCTEIHSPIRQSLDGKVFTLRLTTRRAVSQSCGEERKSFDATIPLVVRGLQPGGYTVEVGGKSATFYYQREGAAPQL